MDGTVYHASPDGRWLISANMATMRRTQPGYGVRVPDAHMRWNPGTSDDDGFYMANLLAEKLRKNGNEVYYVTPHAMVARWTAYTDDQERVHQRLADVGVQIVLNNELARYDGKTATLSCAYTGAEQTLEVENLVLVTCRTPRDHLYHEVQQAIDDGAEGAPKSVKRIGDAEAPAIIAAAVFAGHRFARDLDDAPDPDMPLKIDRVVVK